MRERLPRMFIASSSERLDVAYAIQQLLEFDCEATVWTEGTFRPNGYALDDLLNAVRSHQFGVFVFVPDDRIAMRGEEMPAVRDNLIFEFGLFAGAHGRQSCFFVLSRGTETPRLPTDLAGLMPLSYAGDRSDSNLVAALGPACNQLRRAIAETHRELAAETDGLPQFDLPTAEDYVAVWQSAEFERARALLRVSSLDPHDPEADKARAVLRHFFTVLESMADGVLSGRVEEEVLRKHFADPVHKLWPHICISLAPPNHAEDWWVPPPKLAELYRRWTCQD